MVDRGNLTAFHTMWRFLDSVSVFVLHSGPLSSRAMASFTEFPSHLSSTSTLFPSTRGTFKESPFALFGFANAPVPDFSDFNPLAHFT